MTSHQHHHMDGKDALEELGLLTARGTPVHRSDSYADVRDTIAGEPVVAGIISRPRSPFIGGVGGALQQVDEAEGKKSKLSSVCRLAEGLKALQEHENDIAEVVIVCEPEQASLMMGGLHPRGSLYERPINIDIAKAQHSEFRSQVRMAAGYTYFYRDRRSEHSVFVLAEKARSQGADSKGNPGF